MTSAGLIMPQSRGRHCRRSSTRKPSQSKPPNSSIMQLTSLSSLLLLVSYTLLRNVNNCEAIINGEPAEVGEFPFMVSLRNETGLHYCGGTLVSLRHVVTAAHCLYTDVSVFTAKVDQMYKPEDIKVLVDSVKAEMRPDKVYEAESLTPHPNYNITHHNTLLYDIGVITLKREIEDAAVVPIKPATRRPIYDESSIVLGYGVSERANIATKIASDSLRKVNMTVHNFQHCRDVLRKLDKIEFPTDWMIPSLKNRSVFCAFKENSGACYRDSGSPLVQRGDFVGIIIFGRPCARGIPDIFTTVNDHLRFIEDIVQISEVPKLVSAALRTHAPVVILLPVILVLTITFV